MKYQEVCGTGNSNMPLLKALQASQQSGSLNISGFDLFTLPVDILEPDSKAFDSDVSWWETQELGKLIASHNKLSCLPSAISNLTSLTVLDLGHNSLTELPEALLELEQLKVLDVSANNLRALPEGMGELRSLVRLLCDKNRLLELPTTLGADQHELADVSAQGNEIGQLPPGLASCSSLTRLNLQGNRIAQPPAEVIEGLSGLKDLNLRQNRIGSFAGCDVSRLAHVSVLDLRENGLRALPPEIGGCLSLVELHAGHNELHELPAELARCHRLSVLDLRRNKLTRIPAELSQLRLSLLDLTDNNLSTVPPELGNMTTLRKLLLDGNPLKLMRRDIVSAPTPRLLEWLRNKIPDGGGAVGARDSGAAASRSGNIFGEDGAALAADRVSKLFAASSGVAALNLSDSGLTEVPTEVWENGAQLGELDLSQNKLAGVPPLRLASCTRLTGLDLSANRLSSWPLPEGDGSLPQLQRLSVASNPINAIPGNAFASCFQTLRRVDLTGVRAAGAMAKGTLARLQVLEELVLCQVLCSRSRAPGHGDGQAATEAMHMDDWHMGWGRKGVRLFKLVLRFLLSPLRNARLPLSPP
uniref:Leucine-rich repeat family protein isoform 2 n=2 Tax=Tetraselmis sp. GSL018 TaxID=582737 RepID=A0A061SEL3_9CHLO|mmetsp:Transcript_18661/g.44566  ORF Transcript_18661/g.44566 Transcript_18661/m.44566 type:complete len:586 (+) Transcript_18661:175-1932(+)